MQELEDVNKSQRQAWTSHSSTEVRLNRALEEVEKLKAQIGKMNQANVVRTKSEARMISIQRRKNEF